MSTIKRNTDAMVLHESLLKFNRNAFSPMRNSHCSSSMGLLVRQIEDDIARKRATGENVFVTASQVLQNNTDDGIAETASKSSRVSRKLQRPFSLKKDPLTQTSVYSFFKVDSSKSVHEISSSSSTNEISNDEDKETNVEEERLFFQKASNVIGFNENDTVEGNSNFSLASEMKTIMEERRNREEVNATRNDGAEKESRSGDQSQVKRSPSTDRKCIIEPLKEKRISHCKVESCKMPASPERKLTPAQLWSAGTPDSKPSVELTSIEKEPIVKCGGQDKNNSTNRKYPTITRQNIKTNPKKRKLEDLFGDSGSESEGENNATLSKKIVKAAEVKLNNNKVMKNVNRKELRLMADLVVKHLMPFYKEQRIASRDLFKALARSLAQEASRTTSSSDEAAVEKIVREYFKTHKIINSLSDLPQN